MAEGRNGKLPPPAVKTRPGKGGAEPFPGGRGEGGEGEVGTAAHGAIPRGGGRRPWKKGAALPGRLKYELMYLGEETAASDHLITAKRLQKETEPHESKTLRPRHG